MGGHKKTEEKKPGPYKRKVKKYRVTISRQYRDCNSQEAARAYLKELCDAPIYFLSMGEVEVEEEDC